MTAAKEAVEAAEKAYQKAKVLLDKVKEDNQITAEDNAALEEANQAIKDAKTKAEEALKNLPKDKEQEALKERLDAVNPIEIPENGGNPSTDPEQPTPTDPTDNQGNTGKDKPDVGGQDKDPDTTDPEAPTEVKAVNEEGKTVVTGKTEPNGKVVVNGEEVTADEQGNFKAELSPALSNGEAIEVKAKDAANNVSTPVTVNAPDTTDPEAPTEVKAVNEEGKTVVTGKTEPNGKVVVNGEEVTADEQGNFKAELSPALSNGEAIEVKAKDAANNVSTPVTVNAPDTTDPEAPTEVKAVNEEGKTVVTGKTEPNGKVVVNGEEVTADEQGNFKAELSPALSNGEAIEVKAKDAANNVSTPVTVNAPDTTDPEAPTEVKAVNEEGKTVVTGKTEPNGKVVVNGEEVTADEQGNFKAELSPALSNGEAIEVKAKDAANNVSTPVTVNAPDTTDPEAPTEVKAVNEEGKTVVTGKTEPNGKVVVNGEEVTADEQGNFKAELSPALSNGEAIEVKAKDAANNVSTPVTVNAPDTTDPEAPTEVKAVNEEGKTVVTGKTEPNGKVVVNGEEVTADEQGNFKAELSPALSNGEAIEVKAKDAANNVSTPVTVNAPDTTDPEAPTEVKAVNEEGKTVVTGKTEPNGKVVVNGEEVTADEQGNFKAELSPALSNGEAIEVKAKDAANNVSTPVTVNAPDTTDPEAPTEVKAVNEEGKTVVTGKTEPNGKVVVNGEEVTADEQGNFKAELSPALSNGEAIEVKAKDAANNVSTPVTVNAPDTTDPEAPTEVKAVNEEGKTVVTGKTEPNGKVVVNGEEVTADEQGNFKAELSPALSNGEAIEVKAKDAANNVSTPVTVNAPDTTDPEAPTEVKAVNEEGKTVVTGKTEPNGKVVVNGEEVTADEQGNFKAELSPALSNGEAIEVKAKDAANNVSTPVTVNAPDTTDPEAPTEVKAVNEEGKTVVTGKTEPNGKVVVNGEEVTADEQGNFKAELSPALSNGEAIEVKAKDAANNVSTPVTVNAPDTTDPEAPTEVKAVNEEGKTVVTGKTEPNGKVVVNGEEVTADEQGNFKAELSPALSNGEAIEVKAKDAANNVSTPVTVNAPDTTDPEAPTEVKAVNEEGKTVVTGKTEPNGKVVVNGEEVTADEQGNFKAELSPALSNGEAIEVKAKDAANNVSTPVTVNAPDTTDPEAPTEVKAVNEEGKTVVTGKTEPNGKVVVNGEEVTADEQGNFKAELSPALSNGEAIEVKAKDAANNVSTPVTVNAPDTTDPEAPTEVKAVNEEGKTVVTGKTEPNGKVVVNGEEVTADEQGNFKAELSPALSNGEAIEVKAKDAANNVSTPVTVNAPDTTDPEAPTEVKAVNEEGKTVVTGKTEPNGKVVVNGEEVTADEQGNFKAELSPALSNGEAIEVKAKDAANNVSTPVTVNAPDTTDPEAPTEVKAVNEEGKTVVTGKTEPNGKVVVNGEEVTADEQGNFKAELSPALSNGEAIEVKAKDAANNVSTPVTVNAPDTTDPEAPTEVKAVNEEGKTVVTGKTEPNGKVVVNGEEVTADEQGNFKAELSPALSNGEAIEVKAKDAANNVSTPVTVNAPDTTDPEAPTEVKAVNEEGKTVVTGKTEPNGKVVVNGEEVTADEQGNFKAELSPALSNGEAIEVKAKDAANNVSTPVTVNAPDTTDPEAPTEVKAVNEEGKTVVTGKTEPNGKVVVNGEEVTADEQGNFKAELSPALSNGEAIEVKAKDAANNVSTPVTVNAPDTTDPEAPTEVKAVNEEGKTVVTGKTEPNGKVVVNGEEVTADEQGNFKAELSPALSNGEAIEVKAKDAANNVSTPVTVNAPDTTDPEAPTEVKAVNEEGKTVVTGKTEPNGKVVVNGEEVTADEQGNFKAELSPALSNGEAIEVKAKDAANNVSTPVTVNAPDTTAPETPTLIADSADHKLLAGEADTIKGTTTGDATKAVLFNQNGDQIKEVDINSGSFQIDSTDLPDGNYQVKVKDAAGNLSEAVSITIDKSVPTVTMALAQDTGSLATDKITNNGELSFTSPPGYVIASVTVNGEAAKLDGNKITLPEGQYDEGSVVVTIRNETTGRTATIPNSDRYVVDTTTPSEPQIDAPAGKDTTIALPTDADIGDVFKVKITKPSDAANEIEYRKTENAWVLQGSSVEGVSLANGMITIAQNSTPVGTTINATVTDVAGNSASATEATVKEIPDRDKDGYTDDEEAKAGSDPDLKSSTPKTLAVEAYEKAREAFDAFDAQKSLLAEHGFTQNEVNELNKQLLPLSELKEKAIAAVEWVHTNDDKQDLVDKINALEAVVPDVTNAADAVWQANSRTTLLYRAFWKTMTPSAKYLDDYASENGGIVTINATDIPIKDTLGGESFTIKLAPTDGWKQGTPTPSSASISEYRVDENGNMQIRIDPEVAKKISETTQQFFNVVTEDGTKLTLLVPFTNPNKGGNGIDVVSVSIEDDENPITEVVEKDGTTNDTSWSKILVGVKNKVSSGGNLDGWVVKLEIIDTNEPDQVRWSDTKGNQTAGEKTLTFDARGFNPEDGHTYILRASSYNTNDTTVLGTYTIYSKAENKVTLDTTPPAVEHHIYADEAGKLHVEFTFKEDSLKVWRKDGALENSQIDVLQNYSSAVDVSQKDHKWSTTIRDGESTFVFYDKEGNSQIVDLLKDAKVLRLARLTTNMNKDVGPNNWNSDGNEDQNKDYGSNGLKTESDKDNIIILRQKQGGNGFGGFIDGGTDLSEYKATLQTYDRNDLIDAVGMGGHTDVITGGGADTLILRKGMSGYGPYGYPGGSFDGPQRILMGTGNDTFAINGYFKDESIGKTSMNNTTAKVSMGDGDDTISIAWSIEADHDADRPYSNYFYLGAGDDKMTVGQHVTDTAPRLASNIIDLGSGHDILTVKGNLQDDALILSKDSSTITVGGIGGQANVTMLLGAGDDTVTVRNSVNYSEARDKAIFKEIYDASLKYTGAYQDDVRSWYEESKDALAKLPDNNYIINLGDGNNTMSVGGNMIHAKIESGSGKDTVTINTWVLSSNNIKLGAGNDSISINSMFKDDSISGQSLIYGGEGRDTINLGTPNSDSNKVRLEMYGDIGGNNIDVSSIEVFNLNGKGGTLIIGNKGDIVSGNASTIGPIEVHGTSADSVKLHNSWTLKETTNSVEKYEYKTTGIYVFIDEAINVSQFG
ncbi:Ig-like domain-containing protein [Gallibacterium anatis]|uniref:Ig-like domain-containing protein n=1 Tax=Gallibacterium anatis TaxID=750 RepID=UPI0038B32218